MHSRFPRFASGVLAAAIAAGTTVAVAQAPSTMAPGAAAAAPMAPQPPHAGRHGRMAMELDRLKTSLRLNASQAALWDRAVAQMAPPSDGRDKMRTMHERMTTMLDDPNFDPRRLAAEMDSADAERRARMTSMRDAWFAVYDSLNPVQRGQAREFLRSRFGGHRMGGWMHGRMQDGGHDRMHDGPRDGMRDGMPRPPLPGNPPPPPPPTR